VVHWSRHHQGKDHVDANEPRGKLPGVIFVCAIKTMELGDEAAVAMRLQVSKVSGGWDTLGGKKASWC
jgi:hypothetical protein